MINYIFCLLFGLIRYKYFIVFENGIKKQIYIKHIPDSILFEGSYYNVISETSEIINKTMVYSWLKIEKI